MFVIRQAQMDALARVTEYRCEDAVVAYVKEDFPATYAQRGEEGVRELAARGIARARAYGMSRDTDVVGLVTLAILYGDDFDLEEKYAWMKGILANSVLDPDAKVAKILERIARA